jgi:hypothetical protein
VRGQNKLPAPNKKKEKKSNAHIEACGHGAIGVDRGLYGIDGREVCGGCLLDAISTGKSRGGSGGKEDLALFWFQGCLYLCSQPPRLGLELRR